MLDLLLRLELYFAAFVIIGMHSTCLREPLPLLYLILKLSTLLNP